MPRSKEHDFVEVGSAISARLIRDRRRIAELRRNGFALLQPPIERRWLDSHEAKGDGDGESGSKLHCYLYRFDTSNSVTKARVPFCVSYTVSAICFGNLGNQGKKSMAGSDDGMLGKLMICKPSCQLCMMRPTKQESDAEAWKIASNEKNFSVLAAAYRF